MHGCADLDAKFIAADDAKISIFDWGFLHRDATYDVAHVWQGRFFHLDDHRHQRVRVLRQEAGRLRGLKADPSVLARVRQIEFVAGPKHLAHIDRRGAAEALQHGGRPTPDRGDRR